jgi:hypothetical protein
MLQNAVYQNMFLSLHENDLVYLLIYYGIVCIIQSAGTIIMHQAHHASGVRVIEREHHVLSACRWNFLPDSRCCLTLLIALLLPIRAYAASKPLRVSATRHQSCAVGHILVATVMLWHAILL